MAIVHLTYHLSELAGVLCCLYLPATIPGFVKSFPVFDNESSGRKSDVPLKTSLVTC